MKHLLALMALCVAFAAGAQTGLVEFPYNPDADNDDVIGTADLLALLSLYGSEFSEESLYLNEDSLTALYYTGNMRFHSCFRSCSQLPGRWKIPDAEQIMLFDLASLSDYYSWISNPMSYTTSPNSSVQHFVIGTQTGNAGRIDTSNYDDVYPCYCYTHERPKVEYSYCMTLNETANIPYDYGQAEEFQECCDTKVHDGWYPLGGIMKGMNADGAQAFGAG